MRSASSPVSGSHVSRWYLAFAMPHSSGQQIAAWSPAATPSRVCPSMIRAVRAATETSASRPTTRPAPTAGPWIADTIGLEQSMTLWTRSRASRSDPRADGVVVGHLVDQLEAAAGGERLTGALHNGHAYVRIAVDDEPHVGQLAVSVGADGVEPGPIERDAQDSVRRAVEAQARELSGVVEHRCTLP